jgi:hypothetical protein
MDLLNDYSDDEESAAAPVSVPAPQPPTLPPPFGSPLPLPSIYECCPFLPSPGHLACLLYLDVGPCPLPALHSHQLAGLRALYGPLTAQPPLPLPSSTLHVSLSRPFALPAHCTAALVERLQRGLAAAAQLQPLTPASPASLASPAVFVNEARSAAFLALLLQPSLPHLLAALDAALQDFHLAPMHSPPRLHASIALLPSHLPLPASTPDLPVHCAGPGSASAAAGGGRTPVDHLFLPEQLPPSLAAQQAGAKVGAAPLAASAEAAAAVTASSSAPGAPPAPIQFPLTHICLRAGKEVYKLPL